MTTPRIDVLESSDRQHALLHEDGSPVAQVYGVDLEQALDLAQVFAAAPRMVDALLELQKLKTLPKRASTLIDMALELALGERALSQNGRSTSLS